MNAELAIKANNDKIQLSAIEQVVMQGDLSKLNPEQRVLYYNKVCESVGLNPFTRPFDYISLNGKLTLYAKKDATEQLRKLNGISIEKLDGRVVDDLYIVTATARARDGRMDEATGAVTFGHLKGDAKANAIMKAETKAKRRVTLSISGMGWMDETEVETIPGAQKAQVNMDTGEVNKTVELIQEKVQIIDKITKDQASELHMILGDCDPVYQEYIYDFMKKQYSVKKISDLPAAVYPKMRNSLLKNMEDFIAKQAKESIDEPELLVAEVQ